MVLAIIACILGIVVENIKWPQDREAAKERYIDSERLGEKLLLLCGLVLSHSVVRWLVAFTVAAMLVITVLSIPELQATIRAALKAHTLTAGWLDVIIGLSIAVLMTLLSMTARRLAN